MTNSSFYVYVHRRLDNNVVFYVGKGNGTRLKQRNKRSKDWNLTVEEAKGFISEILISNLSNEDAYKIENQLINEPLKDWKLVNKNKSKSIVELDFDLFNKWFYYDESSPSCLRWKQDVRRGRKLASIVYKKDSIAGSVSYEKYWHVGLNGKLFRGHRIVYLLLNKNLSSELSIDHLNNNSLDNRISNLRAISQSQNSRETSIRKGTKLLKRNKTGATGMSIKRYKYSVSVIARWSESYTDYSKVFNTKKLNKTEEELIILCRNLLDQKKLPKEP